MTQRTLTSRRTGATWTRGEWQGQGCRAPLLPPLQLPRRLGRLKCQPRLTHWLLLLEGTILQGALGLMGRILAQALPRFRTTGMNKSLKRNTFLWSCVSLRNGICFYEKNCIPILHN